MKEIDSIDFTTIIEWLRKKERPIRIENLGGRSSHFYSVENNTILVDNGKGKIKVDLWNRVTERIDALDREERSKASKYNDIRPYVQAPSVPALCWAYCEEKKGKIVWS